MSRIVITAFKPKPGMQQRLLGVIEKHWRVLHDRNLVTDRPRITMQASDGTVVEVFEWRSAEAVAQAHSDPAVLALWSEFEAACDYVPIAAVPESQRLFSEFSSLTFPGGP